MKKLGDKVEFVNDYGPNGLNEWIVSNISIIESSKTPGSDARLYKIGTLNVNRDYVDDKIKLFDSDFNGLLKDYKSLDDSKEQFILKVEEEISSYKRNMMMIKVIDEAKPST